jgi:putative endonuclease
MREADGQFEWCYLFEVYFLYILRTANNTLYIGVTENLEQRVGTHKRGKGAMWTKAHRDVRLVYSESFPTLSSARKREMQLKKWSRAKKEALIVGDLAALKELSRARSAILRRQRTSRHAG